MLPTVATPWDERSAADQTTIPPTTTNSEPGAFGATRRNTSTTASEVRPTATVAPLALPISRSASASCGRGSDRVDRESQQLLELTDDQDDRDAVHVTDEDRPREIVRNPPEAQEPGNRIDRGRHQREQRRELP